MHMRILWVMVLNLLLSGILFSGDWEQNDDDIYYDDGNVGIGTTSPSEKLDVNGTIRTYGSNPYNAFEVYDVDLNATWNHRLSSTGEYIIQVNNGGVWYYPFKIEGNYTGGNYPFIIENDADVKIGSGTMLVERNGNVGIGTDSPNHRLDVNGTIWAKEIVVATFSPAPDFVFEPGYALPTLAEVEDHIKTHKHLPDIPSAEEVEENGVSMGEMQKKLLQKLEEQILYIIELNKQLQAQIEKNNELEERLAKVEGQERSD
ncbi:hypothetical protein JW835_09845 [bacterium]|nr:hypothetical protein [bacterium]